MKTSAELVNKLLKRINYEGDLTPTLATLAHLQRSFLLNVPFENLNIHIGRTIQIDTDSVFQKIVTENRGGFCYECNSLFGDLLEVLNYHITIISARMYGSDNIAGPEFDHYAILVDLDQPYLVDVGQGRGFRSPLKLDGSTVSAEGILYRVVQFSDHEQVQSKENDKDWKPVFDFTRKPRKRADFQAMCEYHQTSPESVFTKQMMATLATPTGRKTLTHMTYKETVGTETVERLLADEDERRACLLAEFRLRI